MKKIYSIILGCIGILGLVIFFDHILGFKEHDYFYIQNPDIEKYVGTNVVSRWADLSFFTYHTLIFFSLWCVLQLLARIFNLNSILNFLFRKDVLSFITTNYIITLTIYTVFELITPGSNFGLYANTSQAWHNFGTNIMVHYVLAIICIINYIIIPTTKQNFKHSFIYITLYLITYFIIVKITGLYSYRIIWYPYPIFDSMSLLELLKLNSNNYILGIIILIITNLLIYFIYMYLYKTLLKCKKNTEA